MIIIIKEGRRKLLELMDMFMAQTGEGFMDVYFSPNSSNCVH